MKRFILFLILIPTLVTSQEKDYKTYDKAVKSFNAGNNEKAKRLVFKVLDKNADWSKPNLLLASIYATENNIEKAAEFLLNVYSEKNEEDVNGIEILANLFYSNAYYSDALYYYQNILKFKQVPKISFLIKSCEFAIESLKNPNDISFNNFGELVNSELSEYVNYITVDGKKLLFTRKVDSKEKRDQEDLFSYDIVNNTIQSLPFNTPQNEGAITVSADGSMYVYTACDRQNTIGGCDLYVRQYTTESGWSKEINLGSGVNSKKWESQACFSPDGKYLYFISNKKGGFGKEDIWRSEINENGVFLPAINLGNIINTAKAEMSPFLHPDNLTLYFASKGHIGMGGYDLFVSRRSNSTTDWSVPENMGYPLNTHNSENSLIVAKNGKEAFYTSDNSGFGQEDIFVFELPENMQAKEVSALEVDILTQKSGEEVVLKNVTFEINSFALEESSYAELIILINYLDKNPDLQVEIQGHTDDVGNKIDNQILSEQRAKVVFEYLSDKVENKLTYKGFGESQPIGKDKAENRRTSFVIKG